ncbi:MAG: LuxR C-terminal-related transcriptional regulator [Bacillota bacterium]|nr:LuxR C-terminal-related transcriptional regulator [Bacillota bacterium]
MPSPRKNYIIRKALFEKLESMPERKLTLVKGAAGSGKTTLLTSFAREKKITDYRWISLDGDNNNIYSFWYYLTEALKECLGEAHEDIMSLFNAVLDKEDIDRLLTIIINQLDTQEKIIIVLDDFHIINDADLLQTIEYFIKNSSDNVHIVILTREEPMLYLSDLIMSGGLLQIDEEDLKLTDQEGIYFLKHTLEISQDNEILKEMNELSEGWVGGLQLIALASANKNTSIRDIKLLNKYVVEYLTKEIVDSLSEEEKEFLVKTSILGYFNENICNKLLNSSNCGYILEKLSEKNLFLINIDEDRGTYRYHNIFGEFLKLRFLKLEEAERAEIYYKAAAIFEELGDYEECLRHLFETRNYNEVLRIIRLMGQNYKAWIYLSQIPLDAIQNDRDIVIQRLFYHYFNGEMEQLNDLFDTFKEKSENDKHWKVLKIAQSLLMNLDLQTDLMSIDEIEKLNLSDITKTIIYIKTAAFLYMQFKLRESLECIGKAEELLPKVNNPYLKMSILSIKSGTKEELGDLLDCENIYGEIFEIVKTNKFMSNLYMNIYVGITGIYLKSGRIEKAEESLNLALEYMGKKTNMYIDAGHMYNLMELRLMQGQKAEAYETAKKLLELVYYKNLLFASGLIKYMIYMGRMTDDLAESFIKTYEECEPKYIRIEDKLTYAKILYYMKRETEALEMADNILQITRSQKIKIKLVEALLFKIYVLGSRTCQSDREILNIMREAVYYSFENHIFSPFLLEGPWILKYLTRLNEERNKDLNSKEKLFINELTAFFKKDRQDDLLSEREIEVLRELFTGASNRQIAEALCISVSTVKTHIINIYSKLQVSSRVEAAEKARKLNLIG